MKKKKSNILVLSGLLTITCLFLAFKTDQQTIEKPEVFVFGENKEQIMEKIKPLCTSIEYRANEPIQLPTAKTYQSQLDCEGFMYAGKKRKVELIFADDALDIVWILTESSEEEQFIEQFKSLYGGPTHIIEDATFFLDHGVAVRNKPHEVLFISERLKEPYAQFLNK